MAKNSLYLSFKNRQALNVAQAILKEEGYEAGQLMSLKERKTGNIVFHFERGYDITVSLVKDQTKERETWLVKEADLSYKKSWLKGMLSFKKYFSWDEGALRELKQTCDWGTPEVAGEETL